MTATATPGVPVRWRPPPGAGTAARAPDVWLDAPWGSASEEYGASWARLSPQERERAGRFVFDHDRELFVSGRGLLRRALDEVLGDRPGAEWELALSETGRPHVDGRSDVDVSISHTPGLVAVAVSTGPRCGIDVEQHRVGVPDFHGSVLTPHEIEALDIESPHETGPAFVRYWALKEAFSKAVGTGLALPFELVEFTPRPAPPRLSAVAAEVDLEGLSSDPRDWHFATRSCRTPQGSATLAVAWTGHD